MTTKDLASEETTVVATYSNRQDAEIAKGFLEDRKVDSFIVADDVHPPFQLTEGVRLLVLSSEAQKARDLLEDAAMRSQRAPADDGAPDEERQDRMATVGRSARVTAWAYLLVFALVFAAIILGLLFLPAA